MKDFTVTWTLQLEAETAAGAAETARDWIVDSGSLAHVFEVLDESTGEKTLVDLDQ